MALRWLEGFDANVNHEALGRVYLGSETVFGAGNNILQEDPAQNRGGTGDALYDRCASDDEAVLHTPDLVASPENSWIVGFAWRPDMTVVPITGSTSPYIAFRNTDGEQLRIEMYDASPASAKPQGVYIGWRIMRGATEIASSVDKFDAYSVGTTQKWIHFEFKVTIDNAAGSVAGRYKSLTDHASNGGAYTTMTWDASVTSVDTQDQTSTGADSFVLSFATGTTNRYTSFDDLYVCDSTGSKNNDYLGSCIVTPHHITTTGGGDGDTVDWTLATAVSTEDAWQEPQTSVENDDRLTSDTTGQIHLAAFENLDLIDAATIIGVRYDLHGRMETSGTLGIGFMWRKTTATAAQTEFGTALSVSSTTMEAATVIAEDDPNTLTDWTYTDVNTLQLGAKNNG